MRKRKEEDEGEEEKREKRTHSKGRREEGCGHETRRN